MTPASAGTRELAPAITSCASRRSSATFSACIMAVRRSASAVSSPACGASLSSSSTAWRSQSPSRLARSTSARWACAASSRRAARLPQRGDLGRVRLEPAEGIEQAAVGGGIDQRALVVLAVDLDQRAAEFLQHLHAHRLIVDEGARAPVGELHAAQDQFVLGRDIVGLEQRARRMSARHLEHRRHLALLDALPHQRLVAAGAEPSAKASSRIDLPAPVSPVSTASRRQNRCRAGRSGRCRGSKAGRAWTGRIQWRVMPSLKTTTAGTRAMRGLDRRRTASPARPC